MPLSLHHFRLLRVVQVPALLSAQDLIQHSVREGSQALASVGHFQPLSPRVRGGTVERVAADHDSASAVVHPWRLVISEFVRPGAFIVFELTDPREASALQECRQDASNVSILLLGFTRLLRRDPVEARRNVC